jgi:hypothetical protein
MGLRPANFRTKGEMTRMSLGLQISIVSAARIDPPRKTAVSRFVACTGCFIRRGQR